MWRYNLRVFILFQIFLHLSLSTITTYLSMKSKRVADGVRTPANPGPFNSTDVHRPQVRPCKHLLLRYDDRNLFFSLLVSQKPNFALYFCLATCMRILLLICLHYNTTVLTSHVSLHFSHVGIRESTFRPKTNCIFQFYFKWLLCK